MTVAAGLTDQNFNFRLYFLRPLLRISDFRHIDKQGDKGVGWWAASAGSKDSSLGGVLNPHRLMAETLKTRLPGEGFKIVADQPAVDASVLQVKFAFSETAAPSASPFIGGEMVDDEITRL